MADVVKRVLFRRIAIVIWISFVAACSATMVFFAMFDPETLGQVTTWPVKLTRIQGYSIGFLLFWFLTALTSATTTFMLALPIKKLAKLTSLENNTVE